MLHPKHWTLLHARVKSGNKKIYHGMKSLVVIKQLAKINFVPIVKDLHLFQNFFLHTSKLKKNFMS